MQVKNLKRYTLVEILEGIVIVGLLIFVFHAFAEILTHEKTYDNYCCCNEFDFSDNYGNSFCLHYNSTKKYMWNLGNLVQNLISGFRGQNELTDEEFNMYLYRRNIPLYVLPNMPCYYMLDRLNLKQKYSCIDINLVAN